MRTRGRKEEAVKGGLALLSVDRWLVMAIRVSRARSCWGCKLCRDGNYKGIEGCEALKIQGCSHGQRRHIVGLEYSN